jgi:hypothetical protein
MEGASRVPLMSREVARESSAEAGGLLGTGLDISASWTNLLSVATGVRRWGLHGLPAERVAVQAEVEALESDSQLLRRRWKWWREQNGKSRRLPLPLSHPPCAAHTQPGRPAKEINSSC